MFVKIKFHGVLKKLCPKVYEIEASTPAEAVRGLTNQLKSVLIRKDGTRFQCRVKECPTKESLFSTFGDITELNIYPSFIASGGGGKNAGWISIAVGAVLIVGSILYTGGLGAFASFGALSETFSAMGGGAIFTAGVGASLMLSGISTFLTPVPKTSNTSESQVAESRFFNHNQNTTAVGTRVAVAYGRNKIYGQLLSFNTQAVDRG